MKTFVPRPALLALLALLALAAFACVDETGYDCADGETGELCVDETGYECGDGSGEIFVDETGYLKPDFVTYSAPAPLDGAQPVVLFGLPGALCTGGGTLVVEGPGDAAPATLVGPDDDGAFRVDLQATAGDALTFRYTPPDGEEGMSELVLEDALSDVPAPGISPTGPPLLTAPNADGQTAVEFSALDSGQPPFVAFNDTAGGLAVVSDNGVGVLLDASTGDDVCVYSLGDGAQSPLLCQPVP